MAQFSLNIYGNNDEILKTFETDIVRWGIFLQALEINDELDEMATGEQVGVINEFVKKIFPDITDKDIENADINDVMNTFKQLINKAAKIGGGKGKNVTGAV